MRRLLQQLLPFIILGIGIVALAFGLILLAYLFIFGAIVGAVLFLINYLQAKFSRSTALSKKPHTKPGRTIDSDRWNKL